MFYGGRKSVLRLPIHPVYPGVIQGVLKCHVSSPTVRQMDVERKKTKKASYHYVNGDHSVPELLVKLV